MAGTVAADGLVPGDDGRTLYRLAVGCAAVADLVGVPATANLVAAFRLESASGEWSFPPLLCRSAAPPHRSLSADGAELLAASMDAGAEAFFAAEEHVLAARLPLRLTCMLLDERTDSARDVVGSHTLLFGQRGGTVAAAFAARAIGHRVALTDAAGRPRGHMSVSAGVTSAGPTEVPPAPRDHAAVPDGGSACSPAARAQDKWSKGNVRDFLQREVIAQLCAAQMAIEDAVGQLDDSPAVLLARIGSSGSLSELCARQVSLVKDLQHNTAKLLNAVAVRGRRRRRRTVRVTALPSPGRMPQQLRIALTSAREKTPPEPEPEPEKAGPSAQQQEQFAELLATATEQLKAYAAAVAEHGRSAPAAEAAPAAPAPTAPAATAPAAAPAAPAPAAPSAVGQPQRPADVPALQPVSPRRVGEPETPMRIPTAALRTDLPPSGLTAALSAKASPVPPPPRAVPLPDDYSEISDDISVAKAASSISSVHTQ